MQKYHIKCPDISMIKAIAEKAVSMGYNDNGTGSVEYLTKMLEDFWASYKKETVFYLEEDRRIRFSNLNWVNDYPERIGIELHIMPTIFEDIDFIL